MGGRSEGSIQPPCPRRPGGGMVKGASSAPLQPESLPMSAHSRVTTTILGLTLLAFSTLDPVSASTTPTRAEPIRVQVDMTDAPQRVLHTRLVIPVRPGEVTLFYPKWIPGEHGPTGPLVNVAGLTGSAAGETPELA